MYPFVGCIPDPLLCQLLHPRHKEEQERKQQLEARKERRQTGEIDNLRTRLREYEAREKEKEEEMKALKRSLRQKELSLLGGPQPGLTDRP
jgi:hypothetical protein